MKSAPSPMPTRSVDEASYLRLYAKLAEVLGTEEALTLMQLLWPERFERAHQPSGLTSVG